MKAILVYGLVTLSLLFGSTGIADTSAVPAPSTADTKQLPVNMVVNPETVSKVVSDFFTKNTIIAIIVILAICAGIYNALSDNVRSNRVSKEVEAAEQQAFVAQPENAKDEQTAGVLQMGRLFSLYNRQIEKYQTQTQSRAGWSFFFAIVAMIFGLMLVIWGGTYVMLNKGWEHIAAGGFISTVGAAVSAYITKTFLDVHKLSLIQLNHYFRQPVLNAHILTAQRLADQFADATAKKEAYKSIIESVVDLIDARQIELTDINGRLIQPVSLPEPKRSPKKKVNGDDETLLAAEKKR